MEMGAAAVMLPGQRNVDVFAEKTRDFRPNFSCEGRQGGGVRWGSIFCCRGGWGIVPVVHEGVIVGLEVCVCVCVCVCVFAPTGECFVQV